MEVNATTLAGIRRNYSSLFIKGTQAYTQVWPKLAERLDGAGFSEVIFDWIGGFPALASYKGDLKIDNPVAAEWSLKHEPFAAAIALKEEDIERDKVGLYRNRVQEMGRRGKQHPDFELAKLLSGGFTKKDYTGKYFFDEDKLHYSAIKDKKFTNVGTAALAEASLQAALTQMDEMKDEKGMPVGSGGKKTLVVPPALQWTARKLLNLTTVTEGGQNIMSGVCDLEVWPMLTSSTAWFLLDLGASIKPFLFSVEKDLQFLALDDPNGEHWFHHHEALYQVYYRGKIAYGAPQLAWGSLGDNS